MNKTSSNASAPVALSINDLTVTIKAAGQSLFNVIDGVSLQVRKGETVAIVGESGCGKSMLSLSVMGLLPPVGSICSGSIALDGKRIDNLPAAEMNQIRGRRIAMIFQEPMTSLNPLFTVGTQLSEAIRAHDPGRSSDEVRERVIAALRQVQIPSPERRVDEYPHQMSGGMRQRVMIAMALSCNPEVLIADEPTTALDVTMQAQILDLMHEIQAETQMAIVFITHDLGVVAQMADRVAVMYCGKFVERAEIGKLFRDAQHPYTIGLMSSIPSFSKGSARLPAIDGMVPLAGSIRDGCRFAPRCRFAAPECSSGNILFRELDVDHAVACRFAPLEDHFQ